MQKPENAMDVFVSPKFPMRYDFNRMDNYCDKLSDEFLSSVAALSNVPMDILKYGSTGAHKMRKIKISQKVKNGDGEVIDIKDEKEYRNKTLVVATHEYMTEFKLENTDDLLFQEEVELWREFEA